VADSIACLTEASGILGAPTRVTIAATASAASATPTFLLGQVPA
jgi:hypothetical protein